MRPPFPRPLSLRFTAGVFFAMSSFSLADSFFSKGSLPPNILGNWSLTMDGAGASPGTFATATDAFTIQAHTMDVSALWTLAGSLAVNTGGTLRLSSNNATLGALTINSGATVSLNVGSNVRTLTLRGNLVNNGTLNALNTGQNTTLRFSSNAAWTGSGTISSGRIQLVVDPSVALDISGLTNDVTFRNSGTLVSTVSGTLLAGTRRLNGNGDANHTFNLASGATLVTAHPNGVNGNFSWAGTLNLNAGANFTFNGAVAQVTGTLMPATVNHLSILNPSGVSLSKATTVSGTLTVGGSSAGDFGTLDLAGFDHSAGVLASSAGGSRVITNNAASGVSMLTVGAGGGSGTYNGTIQGGATASIALTKTGAGTQTLNGAFTYTGATVIDGGTLNLTAASTFTTSALNVNTSGTLRGEGSTTGSLLLGAGSTLLFDGTTIGVADHFRAGLINTTAGAGTKINIGLMAPVASSTGLVVFESTSGGIVTNGLSDFQVNMRGNLQFNGGNTQLLFDAAPVTLIWKGANATNPTFWDVKTTAQNFQLAGVDDFFFSNDSVTFNDTASNFTPTVQAPLITGAITFNNTTAYTVTGAAITALSLTKDGAGKVTLVNASNIPTVTINSGEVQIGDGATASSSLGASNVTNNATLTYDFGALDVTRENNVGGTGAIIKNGSGKLTFSGAITSTGITTINAGTLEFASTAAASLNTVIGGAGNLAKSGIATLTVTTANNYTGLTTVSNGVLLMTNAAALGTAAGGTTVAGSATATAGAALQLSGGLTVADEPLSLSGTGGTPTTGAAQRGALQSVSGNNTWAGPISINSPGAFSTRIGTQDSASLTVSGTITGVGAATGILFRPGAGSTITISGAGNTWSGESAVFGSIGAVVKLGVDNALSITSLLRVGGSGETVLDLNGFSQTANGLRVDSGTDAFAVVSNNGASPSTFTLNVTGANQTFAGVIRDGASTVTVVKAGASAQTLSGILDLAALSVLDGTLNLNTTLADAQIVNTAGILNISANATNSAVTANSASGTTFTVSQTLASLNIGPGAVVTMVAPAPAAAPEFAEAEMQALGAASVPEPGSTALILCGLGALLDRRRRTRAGKTAG